MLKATGAAVAGAALLGAEGVAMANDAIGEKGTTSKKPRKKVLFIGAHPDDNESCGGGTMIKMLDAGFEVVSVYFTHGERGLPQVSLEESARIRTQETLEACKVMGVRPVFMTQIDGASEINEERYLEMQELIKKEHPDAVVTHWPIDSHRDHVNCSVLVLDAWRRVGKFFDIYYYEAMTGLQTKTFRPTDYVDITDFHDQKVKALYCHKCQDPQDWYPEYHLVMEEFRGLEKAVKYAEAFTRFDQNPTTRSLMDI